MNRFPAHPCLRLAAVAAAAAALLSGCGMLDSLMGKDSKSDGITFRRKALDVPPDLTQLSRESRYATQGGVVSAAATEAASAPAGAAAGVTPPAAVAAGGVALNAAGDVHVERDGNQRWLVVPLPPEQVWPQLKAFWQDSGFTLASENVQTGVMETDWAENREKLPQDMIRSSLGRIFSGLYDSGRRDRYRTRVERTPTGSEIYVSHRGLEEVYSGAQKDLTVWQPRPSDPDLEAEMLSRLVAKLAPQPVEQARTAVASAPVSPTRARALGGGVAALEVDEPFDRAWRRVGLALDRGGFTVEDRDRANGLYYVRYVDPKVADKEDPGFFSRLFSFGKDESRAPVRYRVSVKSSGGKTTVSVLSSAGTPDNGENAQRIASQLVNDLR